MFEVGADGGEGDAQHERLPWPPHGGDAADHLDPRNAGQVDVDDDHPRVNVCELLECLLSAGESTGELALPAAAEDVAEALPDAVAGPGRSIGWLANTDGTLSVGFAANGDTNIDGAVDILDAANFVAGNRFDTGAPVDWQDGDFNYDGVLDILDASEFFATGLYDTGVYLPVAVSQVAAVPEPIVPWGWSAAVAFVALACRWSSPVVRRRG